MGVRIQSQLVDVSWRFWNGRSPSHCALRHDAFNRWLTHAHTKKHRWAFSPMAVGKRTGASHVQWYNVLVHSYWWPNTPAHWLNAWYTNIYTYRDAQQRMYYDYAHLSTNVYVHFMRWRKFRVETRTFFYPSPYAVRRSYDFSLSFNGGKGGQKGHLSQKNITYSSFLLRKWKIPKCLKLNCNLMPHDINFECDLCAFCEWVKKKNPERNAFFPLLCVSVFIIYLCCVYTYSELALAAQRTVK